MAKEPKEPGGKDDETTIVVNGEQKTVESRDVSYEQVVQMAFPELASDPNYTFTVLYRKADASRNEGSMVSGGLIKVHKQGTSFSVTHSIRS